MDLKKVAMSYAVFLGFIILTKMVVAPFAKNANIPLLKDL